MEERIMKKLTEKYNGWTNRQTWNIALWIQNDEYLYKSARQFVIDCPNCSKPYIAWIQVNGMRNDRTPDNISFTGTRLNYAELNQMMRDLI